MGTDDLDRVLLEEEELVPSSGFAASVMDAVRQEAATPPPLPFPWKRALPGLAAAGATAAMAVIEAWAYLRAEAETPTRLALPAGLETAVRTGLQSGDLWIALALLLTGASLWVSLRLTRVRLL
jgi:hypothetical protein